MVPSLCSTTEIVPPPAYHRAVATRPRSLHIDALTLVTTLRLLALCRLAVRLAHQICPPPLRRGPGGAPRRYQEESLLLIALLRTLWRLSYQDMHDWLVSWPALARACGLPVDAHGVPHVPSASQMWKRAAAAGAPPCEMLLVVAVRAALRQRIIGARDLIIDSTPVRAWRHADPDAVSGHAPAHHPTRFLRGYRVHTLLCRGSGLPLLFRLAPANRHDAPFARFLLTGAVVAYGLRPRIVRLDAAYWGLRLIHPDPHDAGCGRRGPLEPQAAEEPLLPPAHLDRRRGGQAHQYRALLRARLSVLSAPAPAPDGLVSSDLCGRIDLRGHHHCGSGRRPGGTS